MLLQDIWFFLWGLLWALYFITDGFDLGIGILLPFLGKDEHEKRVIYNVMGPLWDGNEVWLITAGGVTFAAFPKTYAIMFSSFYTALMLILFGLIIRGIAFEFRGKIQSDNWNIIWDTCMFVGSLLPGLLLGVAFGNLFRSIPIDQNGVFHGNLFTLLNAYSLLGGILFLLLFMTHGALWLSLKTQGELLLRAKSAVRIIWWPLVLFAVLFLIATTRSTKLYVNYLSNPVLFLIIIAVLSLLGIRFFLSKGALWKAWFSSAFSILFATFFGIVGLYPNMIPSSMDSKYNITAHNTSSSPLTLKIMLIVAIIFVPIVVGSQLWAYNLFREKIKKEDMI